MTRDELRRSPRYYMCMHGACSCSPQLYTVEKAAYHVFDISTLNSPLGGIFGCAVSFAARPGVPVQKAIHEDVIKL